MPTLVKVSLTTVKNDLRKPFERKWHTSIRECTHAKIHCVYILLSQIKVIGLLSASSKAATVSTVLVSSNGKSKHGIYTQPVMYACALNVLKGTIQCLLLCKTKTLIVVVSVTYIANC